VWLSSTLNSTELDFATPEARALIPPPMETREGLVDLFDRCLAESRALLAAATDGAFGETWSGKNAGAVVFAMPRIAVYRTIIMNHAIHHRAQLGVYLRLLDVPVPALYGPSADEGK
jgi:hypothetical protein